MLWTGIVRTIYILLWMMILMATCSRDDDLDEHMF